MITDLAIYMLLPWVPGRSHQSWTMSFMETRLQDETSRLLNDLIIGSYR